MRLFVLARHAESTLNYENRVNGDPSVPAGLTDDGRAQARLLGQEIAQLPVGVCIHTRFERTRLTAEQALAGRHVAIVEEPLLDDIDIGELEGSTVDDYRRWKRARTRADAFPGGESLDDAARRYARGFAALLARPEPVVLVVAHEIPVRYALNAASGSHDLDAPVHDVPNARPYLFDARALTRAVEQIARLTSESAVDPAA